MAVDVARRALEKWASARDANCRRRPRYLEQRLSDVETGPLFLLEKGVVVTSAHVGHYLSTRVATLPIAKFTSHDLRRTAATMLAEMGIALDLVAAIVGHELEAGTLARWFGITCAATCLSARRMRSRSGTTDSRAL